MTVAELIKELEMLENQDARVVISGYEGGYSDVSSLEKMTLLIDYYEGTWYYGSHEEVSCVRDEDSYKKEGAYRLF